MNGINEADRHAIQRNVQGLNSQMKGSIVIENVNGYFPVDCAENRRRED
jgi:hypothetical protein